MRVIGWVRVSTDEQTLSPDAQKAAILAEIDRRGWSLFSWFVCTVSARSKNGRPPPVVAELEIPRGMCRRGEADGIIATKMDRLSRFSPLTRELWMEAADPKHGYALVAMDNPNIDSSTAAGKLQLGMFALFAEYEGDLISERTKAALAVKKANGVRLGRPRQIPDTVCERIRAFAAVDGGMSVRRIASALNEAGVPTVSGKPWQPSTVHAILARG